VISAAARYARDLDRVSGDQAAPPGPVDPSPALGVWLNTNRSTWGVERAELARRDGGVEMHVLAADPLGESHDWGRTVVERLYTDGPGSPRLCGYTATFDLGHARTHIQTNLAHGLTVIAAFTTFTDGSGRSSYLSREYFYRQAAPAAAGAAATADPKALAALRTALGAEATAGVAVARGDDRLPMLRAGIEAAPLLCRWRNADETSGGVAEISCELRDGQLVVRAVAAGPAGPIDWGDTIATLHTDLCSTGGGRASVPATSNGLATPHYADASATDVGPAFAATFDHGFQRVHMQARFNLGVLVVAMFSEFTDGSGRADYFHREVYIRAG
jgi:hypothetical protein